MISRLLAWTSARPPSANVDLIAQVPDEILLHIFSYCREWQDAMHIRATCKKFKDVYETDIIKIDREKNFIALVLFWKAIISPKHHMHNTIKLAAYYHPRSWLKVSDNFKSLQRSHQCRDKIILLSNLFPVEFHQSAHELRNRRGSFVHKKIERKLKACLESAPPNTVHLILQDRALIHIPKEIGSVRSVHLLDLSHNLLTSLPTQISNLTAITTLHLAHNMFRTIPEPICTLSQLRELNLACNQLRELPEWLMTLKNLRVVDLMGNPLCRYWHADLYANADRIATALEKEGVRVRRDFDLCPLV